MHTGNGIKNNVSFHFWHFAIQNDVSVTWAEYWGADRGVPAGSINIQEAIITSGLCSQLEGCWVCVCLCVSARYVSVCLPVNTWLRVCQPLSINMHETNTRWCPCLCKLGTYVCMCPHSPTSSQIRGFCNASTKVRVLWWLGCSGRPCLKVTTPHHHIISLPFHTSLSVWLIFKIKLHVLPGSAWLLFSHSENRQSAWG